MQKFIFYIFIAFVANAAYSQPCINILDSIGRKHGFWQLERELFYKKKKDNDHIVITYGIEKGIYVHGKKEGFWSVIDKKDKLYRQEYFINDTLLMIIDYHNCKITSISKVTYKPLPENKKNINGEYINTDVTIFNKWGRVKKRIYKAADGETITEKYNGKK